MLPDDDALKSVLRLLLLFPLRELRALPKLLELPPLILLSALRELGVGDGGVVAPVFCCFLFEKKLRGEDFVTVSGMDIADLSDDKEDVLCTDRELPPLLWLFDEDDDNRRDSNPKLRRGFFFGSDDIAFEGVVLLMMVELLIVGEIFVKVAVAGVVEIFVCTDEADGQSVTDGV